MPKVKYVGDHRAGIYLPGDVFVEHGATVEVSDELADELLLRDGQWVAAKPPKNDEVV
jgi:hypothetical protein